MMKRGFGSLPASNKAVIDRESVRTLKSDVRARELILK